MQMSKQTSPAGIFELRWQILFSATKFYEVPVYLTFPHTENDAEPNECNLSFGSQP